MHISIVVTIIFIVNMKVIFLKPQIPFFLYSPKSCESIVHNQIKTHLSSHNLKFPFQSGFCSLSIPQYWIHWSKNGSNGGCALCDGSNEAHCHDSAGFQYCFQLCRLHFSWYFTSISSASFQNQYYARAVPFTILDYAVLCYLDVTATLKSRYTYET